MLFSVIQLINSTNNKLKETYLKILPVFCSYSLVFGVKTEVMLKVIQLIQGHPVFVKEKRWVRIIINTVKYKLC